MNYLLTTFFELARIDSPSGEEEKVAAYIKRWLASLSFSWKEDALGSILAYKEGKGKPMFFCAHMDTVEGRSIQPVIEDGFIKSAGHTILGADNKAAVAAIMAAVRDHLATEASPRPIEILFTVREETGGGVEYFPFEWITSKKGVIFDFSQPAGAIVLASPYINNFHATFTGKSAHAKDPEKGISAILPAAEFASRVPQGRLDDGKTTINVGKIAGGTGMNIVPEEARVSGEVRSYDKERFEGWLERIKAEAEECAARHKASVEFFVDGYCGGYSFTEKDPFIKKIASVFKALDIEPAYHISANITDSNPLVGAGIEVVTLGDGVEDPHTDNERISVEALERLRQISLTFLKEL